MKKQLVTYISVTSYMYSAWMPYFEPCRSKKKPADALEDCRKAIVLACKDGKPLLVPESARRLTRSKLLAKKQTNWRSWVI